MDLRKRIPEPNARSGGLTNDLRRLRSDGSASVAELREFLGQMRGRSPQEMLGLVAASSLLRSMIAATLLVAAGLVVFTVVPYLLRGEPAVARTTAAAGSPAPAPAEAARNGAPPAAPAPANTNAAPAADPPTPDLEKAADALGVGEAKAADPNTNPLDGKLDKLLDGID